MIKEIQQVIRRLRHNHSQSPAQYVTFEALEARVLMSVTAIFDEGTGTLTLTGDDAHQQIDVRAGDAAGEVTVKARGGVDHDNDPGTDNLKRAMFSGVNTIIINTGDGNDKIRVRNGLRQADDPLTAIGVTVNAGEGKNKVRTGDGDDNITTGSQKDHVRSGDGADFVNTGDGKDKAKGGDGSDTLEGGSGKDHLWGGDDDDELDGDGGNDHLRGGDGADDLDGGEGDDRLNGGSDGDADTVIGGDGNDKINDGDSDADSDGVVDEIEDGDDVVFNESEPNNTTAEADPNVQTLNTHGELKLRGTVGPDDGNPETTEDNVDLFALNLTAAGFLEIEVESHNNQPVTVEILAADGATVLATVVVDPTVDDDEEDELEILAPGTYYVRITSDGDGPAEYEVELDLDSDDGDTDGDSDGESDGDTDGDDD